MQGIICASIGAMGATLSKHRSATCDQHSEDEARLVFLMQTNSELLSPRTNISVTYGYLTFTVFFHCFPMEIRINHELKQFRNLSWRFKKVKTKQPK